MSTAIISILVLPRDRMSRAATSKRMHERAVRVRFSLIHGSLVLSVLLLFLAIYSRRNIYVLLFVCQGTLIECATETSSHLLSSIPLICSVVYRTVLQRLRNLGSQTFKFHSMQVIETIHPAVSCTAKKKLPSMLFLFSTFSTSLPYRFVPRHALFSPLYILTLYRLPFSFSPQIISL